MKFARDTCSFFLLSPDEVQAQVPQSLLRMLTGCKHADEVQAQVAQSLFRMLTGCNVLANSQYMWLPSELDDLGRVRNSQEVVRFGPKSHLAVFHPRSVL